MTTKLISVNIVLGPDAAKSASSTMAKLKSAGLHEANLLEAVNLVTGSIAADKLQALKKIPGVTVEVGDTYQLPPPDSPVQ